MRKKALIFLLSFLVLINISGCVPLIIGGAVGALGGYAASRDTIQAETDKTYEKLWEAILITIGMRGAIGEENKLTGSIEAQIESSRVWIEVIRLTPQTNRLKVSARKNHLPNLKLAEDLFVKIMEAAE